MHISNDDVMLSCLQCKIHRTRSMLRRSLLSLRTCALGRVASAPASIRTLATYSTDPFEPRKTFRRGVGIVQDPLSNKGTGFDLDERDRLRIRGLVPPRTLSMQEQKQKIMHMLQVRCTTDIERGLELQALQDRNETLFYRILIDEMETVAPWVYTPTVGEICKQFGSHFRRTRGMYFSSQDRGLFSTMVYNWPHDDVEVVVVTDGSRILGLGDLGANGMGIPIGKLALYVAAGGIDPRKTLPVTLDCGTDNVDLLHNPYYLGVPHHRLDGPQYYSLVDEFMNAVHYRWPRALIQFEDFNTAHAASILEKYRHKRLCFNDDIQGTGATTLAGLFGAVKIQGSSSTLGQQRIVVCGAGSAGMGVAAAVHAAMVKEGLTPKEASDRFWVLTENGLLGATEKTVSSSQKLFQRFDEPSGATLIDVVSRVKPTVLLGLTGQPGVFTEAVVKQMASTTPRPIIFPLSNPTSRAECSAAQAYAWSDGRCVFASGSPSPPLTVNGVAYRPSQCNNLFIFPGVGLGAVLAHSKTVTDDMFYIAAKTLAGCLSESEKAAGMCFPSVQRVRDVSLSIATAVCREAFSAGLAEGLKVMPSEEWVAQQMYNPEYHPLISVKDYF